MERISEVPSPSEGEIPHTDDQLTADATSLDITSGEILTLQSSSEDDGPYAHAHFDEDQFEVPSAAPPCGLVDLITHPISNVSINRLYQPQHSPITIRSLALEELEEEQEEVALSNLHCIKGMLKPNLKFLPAKLSYFLYFSGLSLINTFFTIFLVNLGLDPEQAGLIQVARSGTMIGSSLFWGWLAHKTNRNMLIICIELLVSTALVNLMPWISHLMVETETAMAHKSHIEESLNESLNQTIEKISSSSSTTGDLQNLLGLNFEASHYRTASPYLFSTMLALSIGFTFFIGGALLLIETRVYNMTKTSRGKNVYGHQRLWGSVSFAITPLIAGAIMEVLPKYVSLEKDPIQVVFYMYMVVMIGAVICCAFLFRREEEEKLSVIIGEASDLYSAQEATGQWRPVKKVLKKTFMRVNNLMLFINIFFLGLVYGIQWNFQFIFMQEVGASKMMIGLAVTIQLLVEAMVYPFAMKLITWLRGNKVVTTITCFSYAVLFFTISVATSPYLMVIPAAFLGFSFTLFHNATMEDLHQIGGTRFLTILQTLYHVVFTGVGCSVSGVAGGIVYHKYSGRVLFFVSGCIMALFCIFNGTYFFFYRRCGKLHKEEKEEAREDGFIKGVYNVGSDYDEGIWDVS